MSRYRRGNFVLTILLLVLVTMSDVVNADAKMLSLDFEIFGRVQGFWFALVLQYTEEAGRKLGLSGWIKNTRQGTVVGQVQGAADKVNTMKKWLSTVGSPSSRIDRADFSNEKKISKLDFKGFSTRF
ncbi:acylphosphatase-2-like [Acipenser oxyrinchus oxyrinchus]|uniref:acylphosphatase n=1 Tax=Acipenser oxyrinchus oxyrinchus TaxID=40147 RepID=A0AAD8GBG3_ACIOX|nr:acylphosphatase-2-like [Acipenser oxyrinchus oxyrinchus]